MKKLSKTAIILITSLIGSWIGAIIDHNNWWGWSSTILGIIGLFAGYLLARMIDNYVDS